MIPRISKKGTSISKMARSHDDVIELGSSDEESQPIPKKKKLLSKAMVHIPNKLPGITIRPVNPKVNPVSCIGKSITVTKVTSGGNKVANPFATNNKKNGQPQTQKVLIQPSRLKPAVPAINPAITILPAKKKKGESILANTKKVESNLGMPVKIPKGILPSSTVSLRSPQRTLPPGITVKKTNQMIYKHGVKRIPVSSLQVQRQTQPTAPKRPKPSEMVCVDLDDDDSTPSSAGPLWYLTPEEQEVKNKPEEKVMDKEDKNDESKTRTNETNTIEGTADIENQNNKELEPGEFIEITIEDSPSKPPKSKRRREVSELAITIDDSPVKSVADNPAPCDSGDDETTSTSKEKQSKKKLEYPETVEQIEIELTPVEASESPDVDNNIDSQNVNTEILEIEESPLKSPESQNASTPKKKIPKPHQKLNINKMAPVKSLPEEVKSKTVTPTKPGEFNPTYQSFIDLCYQLENSEDMNKIVEKKIKAYYRQVPKEYTESEMFIDMVASKISAMRAGPEKMYLYIKDVVDELNMQRKLAKAQPPKLDVVNEEQSKFLYGEESEFDLKRQRQIRKLEKTLKKLHRAIQKLEEQEVDFDDEEDSVYLLTESEDGTLKDSNQPLDKNERLKRYKERMIRVHAKFCQLTNTKMPSEPRVQLDARPGQPKGPAKRLEKWINKKVPIGTPLPFPDFHDVLRCVRDANQEDKLGWNEADIMEEARDLFTRCGKKLQRRRQENEWRLAASRIQSELDPAEDSEDLKKKLDMNRRVASVKESEVLNKFADRQNQLNLEAVEIEDKEAEESPVETDDEEPSEETTALQTKEKRKKRLKRLLQEKSKKPTDEKEQSNKTEQSNVDRKETTKVTDTESTSNKDSQVEDEKSDKDQKSDAESKQNDKANNPITDKDNEEKCDTEKIHSLSDDSNKIDSDIDELHLLQKLHSDVVESSTLESSDSESPIAISDTLSSGDNKRRESDVISIENSSYSESERNIEPEFELVSYSLNKVVSESVDVQMEIECSVAGVQKKINKSNNDEYNESVEDILLASSDDEACKSSDNLNSANEENDHQIIEEMKANSTDATLMDNTEKTASKNNDIIENMEVTSISSTENGDKDTVSTGEETNINPVESTKNEPTKIKSSEVNSNISKDDTSNIVEAAVKIVSEKDLSSNSNDKSKNVTSLNVIAQATDNSAKLTDDDLAISSELDKGICGRVACDNEKSIDKGETKSNTNDSSIKMPAIDDSGATVVSECIPAVELMDVDINVSKT